MALLAFGLLAGCQASSNETVSPPDATAPYCPTTLAQTIGAPCAEAGLLCGPEYTCDLIQVSLLCVCTEGLFRCTDGLGHVLEGGQTPVCPSAPEAGTCPATEDLATSASCTDQGLLCSYAAECEGGLDQCQCFPGALGDGGFGLLFECQPAYCGSDAATDFADSGADAGDGSSDGADAGSDALESDAANDGSAALGSDATSDGPGTPAPDATDDAAPGSGRDASADGS